jgi:alpha-beta hydrolase superfamily lysophospholipase
MLHGAGGGGWEWNVWARVFAAAGRDVHAPDLQAVAAGLAATRLADYRAQAGSVLLGLPRPRVLVGASLGGLLAYQCVAAADALVLVNPLPPAPWNAGLRERVPAAIVPWGSHADLAGTRAAIPDAHGADAWFAFRHWRDESGGVLADARAATASATPTCPVLVLASGADADIPLATQRAFATAMSADFLELENASHVGALFGTSASDAAERVLTWLNVKIA